MNSCKGADMLNRLDNDYHFNNNGYKHFIVTPYELSEDEQRALNQILKSFPHGDKSDCWPEQFSTMNTEQIPRKLLLLAANAYDEFGNTMLGVAAEYGEVSAVQRLIDMGAAVDAIGKRNYKLPALHWAICNKLSFNNKESYEAVQVVKCLLVNRARTDITYHYNMTPLKFAQDEGYIAAAHLIEESMIRKQAIEMKLSSSSISHQKTNAMNLRFLGAPSVTRNGVMYNNSCEEYSATRSGIIYKR